MNKYIYILTFLCLMVMLSGRIDNRLNSCDGEGTVCWEPPHGEIVCHDGMKGYWYDYPHGGRDFRAIGSC